MIAHGPEMVVRVRRTELRSAIITSGLLLPWMDSLFIDVFLQSPLVYGVTTEDHLVNSGGALKAIP